MRRARIALFAPALLLCACEPLDQGGGAGVGGRIAFLRDGALVTSQDSGDGELIITDPGTSGAPALTSNGQTVIFPYAANKDENARGLFRVSSSGGTPEELVAAPAGTTFDAPSLSKDGQKIAFVATTTSDGASRIWIAPASGGTPAPAAGSDANGDLRFPAWLDADTLLVSKGAANALHKLDLAIGALTDLGLASASRAAASPDGKRIAYAKGSPAAIVVRDLATGVETTLASTGRGDNNPAFSPEGTLVAFDAKGQGEAQAKVYAASADGTGTVALLQTGAQAAWSP
jgi:Tol biopolymer transport system component